MCQRKETMNLNFAENLVGLHVYLSVYVMNSYGGDQSSLIYNTNVRTYSPQNHSYWHLKNRAFSENNRILVTRTFKPPIDIHKFIYSPQIFFPSFFDFPTNSSSQPNFNLCASCNTISKLTNMG